MLRPLHASCALRSAAGESGCPAWLSGSAPASGGSWDDGLDLAVAAAADFSGCQAYKGICHGAGSWLCPAVCSGSSVPAGGGQVLRSSCPAPPPTPNRKEQKPSGGLPRELCSGPECLIRGRMLLLKPTSPEGACGREKQARVSYYRRHKGLSLQQSSVSECGH